METEFSQISSVRLKRERSNFFSIIIRTVSFFIGLFGFIISLGMFFTLIGIPIAIFMFIGSAGFFAMSIGRQRVTCPICNHSRNYATKRALNFTCTKCKKLTTIDWD